MIFLPALMAFSILSPVGASDPVCTLDTVREDVVDGERTIVLTLICTTEEGEITPQREEETEITVVLDESSLVTIFLIVDYWLDHPGEFQPPESTTTPPSTVIIQDN